MSREAVAGAGVAEEALRSRRFLRLEPSRLKEGLNFGLAASIENLRCAGNIGRFFRSDKQESRDSPVWIRYVHAILR